MNEVKRELLPEQREELLAALKERFHKHMERHEGVTWDDVQARLESHAEKLWSLYEMERTGGEPDVVGVDEQTGEYTSSTVHRRARRDAGACATTRRHGNHARRTNRRPARWRWRRTWASRC